MLAPSDEIEKNFDNEARLHIGFEYWMKKKIKMNRAYGKNEKWLQIQSRNVYRHFLEVIFETLNHVRTHTNTLTTKRFSLV